MWFWLKFNLIVLGVLLGIGQIRSRQAQSHERACACVCGDILGGWPETGEIVRAYLERGETQETAWFVGGVRVCLRPEESQPELRLRSLQAAVDHFYGSGMRE